MTAKYVDRALRTFNEQFAPQLREAAAVLRARGVRRVHYGVDYVNDDGDVGDYAVYEYEDGRVVELDAWPEELGYDVFLSVEYCQPYTFEVDASSVLLDRAGGQVDVEENVIRNYHTDARRRRLEAQAEVASGLETFNAECWEELGMLAAELRGEGIARVSFGIDCVRDDASVEYHLSDWCFVHHHDDRPVELRPQLDEMRSRGELWSALPVFGAFELDAEMSSVWMDTEGGTVRVSERWTRAYHSAQQRAALEAEANA